MSYLLISTWIFCTIGINLSYREGQVFVKCLSETPIFVQSRNAGYFWGNDPTTVYKLLHEQEMKIFDGIKFSEQLAECAQHGYKAVFDMKKTCKIKISFVKGWGQAYHRKDVHSTPCSIEIMLNYPLIWVDRILKEMHNPDKISSVT